jgi:hypothetical protein
LFLHVGKTVSRFDLKVDDSRADFFGCGLDQANGDGELKAARAAGAGVEVEDAILCVVVRHVSMAVENDSEFGCGGIEVQGLEVVEYVEVAAFSEKDFGFGKFGAGAFAIDVAANGSDGRDFGELVEDGDFAHVAYVKDLIDAFEIRSNLRPE